MKDTPVYPIDDDIKTLASIFKKNGYQLYLVGGAVRDFLLGRKISDIDFTTDATPSQMQKIFQYTIETGIKHGTLTIPFRKKHYEVTTFRKDGDYVDSRHPEDVDFITDLKEDLSRRDFTINAIAANALTGEIIDKFNGIGDIKIHMVRTVGEPEKRFSEDALRMLRALRFTCTLNFNIEQKCFESIIELSDNISKISKERIQSELFKIFSSPFAHRGLLLLHKSRLLYVIDQSIENNYNTSYPAFVYATAANAPLSVRLATLFCCDAQTARKSLRNLKCSNAIIDSVSSLLEASTFEYSDATSDIDVRKFIVKLGKDRVDDFIALMFANAGDDKENAIKFAEHIKKILRENSAITIGEMQLTGYDVIKCGISGKEIGKVLNMAHNFVLSAKGNNTRDKLTKFLEDYISAKKNS